MKENSSGFPSAYEESGESSVLLDLERTGGEGEDEKKKGVPGKEREGGFLTFTHLSAAVENASRVYGYRVEAVYDQTYHVRFRSSSLSLFSAK